MPQDFKEQKNKETILKKLNQNVGMPNRYIPNDTDFEKKHNTETPFLFIPSFDATTSSLSQQLQTSSKLEPFSPNNIQQNNSIINKKNNNLISNKKTSATSLFQAPKLLNYPTQKNTNPIDRLYSMQSMYFNSD